MATILTPATKHSPVAITSKQPVSFGGVMVQPGEVIHVSEKAAAGLLGNPVIWAAADKASAPAPAPASPAPAAAEGSKKPAA